MDKNSLTKTFNKINFKIKKYSPELFLIGGIIGTIGSTILACKATLKIKEIKEENKQIVNQIHKCEEDEEFNYNKEDMKHDLTLTYFQTGVRILKVYAPSIILGTISMASIINGHKILKKRNVALAAAYTVVDKTFKTYRKNAVERFGEEVDKELLYSIKEREIEEKIKDKNGKEKIIKKKVKEMGNPDDYTPYARFYDCGNRQWSKDPEYNLMFLRRQQEYANDKLRTNGYVFLNEIYEALDIPKSREGQLVGWIYDENDPTRSNYIDFGIYDPRERNIAFVNGYESSILLNFKPDGPIYNLI